MAGYDYTKVSGRLVFEDKEVVKQVHIPLLPISAYDDKEEEFLLVLKNPSDGTILELDADGKPQEKVRARRRRRLCTRDGGGGARLRGPRRASSVDPSPPLRALCLRR
jgi:hypothetical protein